MFRSLTLHSSEITPIYNIYIGENLILQDGFEGLS